MLLFVNVGGLPSGQLHSHSAPLGLMHRRQTCARAPGVCIVHKSGAGLMQMRWTYARAPVSCTDTGLALGAGLMRERWTYARGARLYAQAYKSGVRAESRRPGTSPAPVPKSGARA